MIYKVSERPGRGRYVCIFCGDDVFLENDDDTLPPCASCEMGEFRKG